MTGRLLKAGLAPSTHLAPSLTLAPSGNVYGGAPITPHRITMGVGTGGAYVDVSSYVEFGEGISYTYGRQTQFDDAQPGVFTFTLNNTDGRFTPDNPTSPLATKVTEGMGVCWQLGTRLVHGTILSLEIPADEATWDHLIVTCDDMLGTAARHMLTNLPDMLSTKSSVDLMWRLDEPSGETAGVESAQMVQDGLGSFNLHSSNPNPNPYPVVFGDSQAPGLPGTAMTLSAAPGETNWFGTKFGNTALVSRVTYPVLAVGQSGPPHWWGMWVYPNSTINLAVTPQFSTYSMQLQCTPSTYSVVMGNVLPRTYTMTNTEQTVPHYVNLRYQMIWIPESSRWQLAGYLYVDGVFRTSEYWQDPTNGFTVPNTVVALSPVMVNVSVTTPSGAPGPLSGTVQRISHTSQYAQLEQNALFNVLEQRRAVLDYLAADISSATYNGPLSTAPIGFPDLTNTSVLDVYNDVARTEAGHLFTTTTGTVTNPVEQIQVRARDRTTTPKTTFDVSTEGSGLPSFVRDITNVATSVQVQGPLDSVTVADATITGRTITSTPSETVLYTGDADLALWGQDRLYRGRNRSVRAQTFTVDAVTTAADRSPDLLALVPGDRIRLSNTPTARLGFASWDGWILGASERHTVVSNGFTFNLAPVLPVPATWDSGIRYGNGGSLTLTNALTATDTGVTFTSTDGSVLSTEVPYACTIGSEQITITAVSGNTATVARGVNGTTATAHDVTAAFELVPQPVYVY